MSEKPNCKSTLVYLWKIELYLLLNGHLHPVLSWVDGEGDNLSETLPELL